MMCFLWKLSRGLISSYNLKWQRSDGRGLYAVPPPLVRGALCQSGEPGYLTCSLPASVGLSS